MVPKKTMNEENGERRVSIVPAPSSAVRYIKDTPFLPEEKSLEIENVNKQLDSNVQFL